MTPGFSLFRLPHLPLEAILNLVSPKELLFISLCSNKARRIAKQLRHKSRNLKVLVTYMKKDKIINVEDDELESLMEIRSMSEMDGKDGFFMIGSECIPYVNDRKYGLCTFWNDTFHGTKCLLSHITDFFDCEIGTLDVNADAGNPYELINWVMSSQGSVDECNLFHKDAATEDEDLKRFLSTSKIEKYMELNAKPSKDFQHTFSLDIERVVIGPSYWVSIENLMAMMNSKFIHLKGSVFDSNQINKIFKNWKNGMMPSLKLLILGGDEELDMAQVTIGLNGTRINREEDIVYDAEDDLEFDISHGIQITREDGVVATIVSDDDFEVMFFVWPDFKGTPYTPPPN